MSFGGIGSEVTVGVFGVIATATAWFLGGKQTAKNERNDVLTKGADQIVESSNKLVQMLEKMVDEERGHRNRCEDSLHDHKLQLDALGKKLAELENKLNKQK